MSMQDDVTRNEAQPENAAGQADSATAEPAQNERATQLSTSDKQTDSELTQTVSASSEVQDEATAPIVSSSATPQKTGTRLKRYNQAKQAASLRKLRLGGSHTSQEADTTVPVVASVNSDDDDDTVTSAPVAASSKSRRKDRKDRLENWDQWSKFRLWRRTRPFAGSILMLLSSFMLLALGIYFLPFAFLINSVWISLFLGGLLLVMALIQIFLPSYTVITGSIGILVSLVSFFTSTFGGLIIGMLLGIIGGALSVSWRPVKRARLVANSSSSTQA